MHLFVRLTWNVDQPLVTVKNHTFGQNQNLTDSVLLKYMENYFLQPYKYSACALLNEFFKELLDERKIKFDENLSQLEDVKFVSKYLRYTKKGHTLISQEYFTKWIS